MNKIIDFWFEWAFWIAKGTKKQRFVGTFFLSLLIALVICLEVIKYA